MDIEDLNNQILQILVLLQTYYHFCFITLTPINIARKVDTEDEQLMITFLWEVCIPPEFITEIYASPNYQIIADPKLTYQKANKLLRNGLNQQIKMNFRK